MLNWLRKYRARIAAEADEFMESFGQNAYAEARKEMRKARERSDTKQEKFFSKVAAEIAAHTNIEIGRDKATRYLEKQASYQAGPGFVRKSEGTMH